MFFSLPFAFVCLDPDSTISALAWAGVAVWAVGNVGTIAADRQLARVAREPGERGEDRAGAGSGAGPGTRTTSSSG